jgi:hypothetical protein
MRGTGRGVSLPAASALKFISNGGFAEKRRAAKKTRNGLDNFSETPSEPTTEADAYFFLVFLSFLIHYATPEKTCFGKNTQKK